MVFFMKRIISTKVSEKELIDICDEISKMDVDCSIESKTVGTYSNNNETIKSLRIKLYGYDRNKITEDYKDIRNMMERIKRKHIGDKNNYYHYTLNDLKYPVNKELIFDTLKALNVDYVYEDNTLKCKCPLNKLIDIVKDLHNIYSEMEFMNIGSKPVKNVIALVSFITGKDIEEILNECLKEGYLREEDYGKIVLNKDINYIKKHYGIKT